MYRKNPFVDTEAEVEEGSEVEVSQNELDLLDREAEDEFIDDEVHEDPHGLQHGGVVAESNSMPDRFDDFLAGLLAPSKETSSGAQCRRFFEPTGAAYNAYTDGDFPLWKIQCRYGVEEIAVLSIYRKANEKHRIRSAFTRETVRGSIYIESELSTDTIKLLKETPGIIVGRGGVLKRRISMDEFTTTLSMTNIDKEFNVGEWVLVQRGSYKGDVGIVSNVHGWGVGVLLVPCLLVRRDHDFNQKRKRTIVRPLPRLFNPEELGDAEKGQVRTIRSGIHIAGNQRFEHGLISKDFEFKSLDKRVFNILQRSYDLFEKSLHPRIVKSASLAPIEWSLLEGERIFHTAYKKYGTIVATRTNEVEVDFDDEGLQVLWWRHIRKVFYTGEEVTVTGGLNAGLSGWVLSCNEDVATVMRLDRGQGQNTGMVYTEQDVVINTLKRGASRVDKDDAVVDGTVVRRKKAHPWIGMEVQISRQTHARKGHIGEIMDIFPPKPGCTNPSMTLRLTRYNPSEPYPLVTVEYSEIVEKRSLRPLHKVDLQALASFTWNGSSDDMPRGQTPMPAENSSTPAWDPHHNIDDWDMLQIQESISDSAIPVSRHVLVNPIFTGVKLKVHIEGQDNTGIVTVDFSNGKGCLREVSYHTSNWVPEHKVTPKHPNPAHDNGLLMIIKGEYIGKHARRVHHRHRKEGMTLVKVAIVEVTEGSIDRDTGRILEMETGDLCTVEETEEQKKRNKKPMEEMRHRLKKAPLS